MSRNLGTTQCYSCGEDVVLEESPRAITRQEAGAYFDEYRTMKVAKAHCPDCLAQYLAWCKPPTRGIHKDRPTLIGIEGPFYDLSYRSSFNDEPGLEDGPKYQVVQHIVRERFPLGAEVPRSRVHKVWEE